MVDSQGALFTILSNDGPFLALLSSYTPGDNTARPALFTNEIPTDHRLGQKPTAVIDPPDINVRNPDSTDDWRDVTNRIRFYHIGAGSNLLLIQAAEAAAKIIDSISKFNFGGDIVVDATVNGPVRAPTSDPSADGLLLNARLNIKES